MPVTESQLLGCFCVHYIIIINVSDPYKLLLSGTQPIYRSLYPLYVPPAVLWLVYVTCSDISCLVACQAREAAWCVAYGGVHVGFFWGIVYKRGLSYIVSKIQ